MACVSVHAAFYLWYGTPAVDGAWRHWDHPSMPHWTTSMNLRFPPGVRHQPPDAPHSPFYPARGVYSSGDMAVLTEQMSELARAGVDSVMLSWWGQQGANVTRDSQGVSTDERVAAVLEAAASAGVGVSWHLEPYGGRTPASIVDDLRYLARTYGQHPAVWRSDTTGGRPLVFLYDVSFEHSGNDQQSRDAAGAEWRRVLAGLRGTDADAMLLSLYIDERDDDFLIEAGIDGAYSYFAADGFTHGATAAKWHAIVERLGARGKHFVPSVGPGYDDTRIRPWNAHNMRAREAGAYYDRMWEAALAITPFAISITSYNEWGEGTQIEGARTHTSKAGEVYLGYEPHAPDFYLQRTSQWTERVKERCARKSPSRNMGEKIADRIELATEL